MLNKYGEREMKQIKIIFSDVDGTLTDGRLYYGPKGELVKVFHAHDGSAIKEWQKSHDAKKLKPAYQESKCNAFRRVFYIPAVFYLHGIYKD